MGPESDLPHKKTGRAMNQNDCGDVHNDCDEAMERLYEYLASNFTPDTPVPELPAALLEAWTSY